MLLAALVIGLVVAASVYEWYKAQLRKGKWY